MRNPLNKRLPRELKGDITKYLVLFLFLTVMIAFVSGFLVASDSMLVAYDESFDKYNIEDGNFELATQADETLLKTLEHDTTIYENFYIEKERKNSDSTLRIFQNREDVNKVCVMEGELPVEADEIAIDRMFADNNNISVGDTISFTDNDYKVSGLVALSDYSALYSSQTDMMFDALKFGVAVVTEDGFQHLGESGKHFSYSWKYTNAPEDDIIAKEMSEDYMEHIAQHAVITNFVPQFSNQAIQFTGNDLGSDNTMIEMFLYIIIVIIAFTFAITTSNTIAKEANVIGTLRASGYTKGELIRHYLAMPILVTLISAILGNIIGYTWFKDVAASLYYNSYSLPTYVTLWNADAFIKTTLIPVILIVIINLAILTNKLSLSPLKFIRRDLSRRQKKKAFRLNTKIGILKRFRLRIIFQNMPNYITIIIGIFLANILLLFGLALPPLMEKNQEDITSHMVCDYQYILKAPAQTQTEDAEKYCAGSLKTLEGKLKSESVSLFGVVPDSKYIPLKLDDNSVYISNCLSEKFGVAAGDTLTLKEEYGTKEFSFHVKGVHYYPAGIAVFMSQEYFNKTLENDVDYFNGYFSNKEITDIDEMLIATKITEDDLTKTARQMMHSMGGLMDLFAVIGLMIFMLIIYLLSKIIIEKNSQSISMTKILGYSNKEISGLYVVSTSLVVIGSLILTIPIANAIIDKVFVVFLSEYSGWLPYYVPFSIYIEMAVLGIVAYGIIAFFQFRKVKKIPMDMALKNLE